MDAIFIEQMQFFARHGVFPEETKLGQRFVVSLSMRCDVLAAGLRDDLALTVNYGEVYNVVRDVIEGTPRRLLEAVAQAVADAILARFALVGAVRVRIEKPGAPIDGVFGTVGVEIDRERTGGER